MNPLLLLVLLLLLLLLALLLLLVAPAAAGPVTSDSGFVFERLVGPIGGGLLVWRQIRRRYRCQRAS
jgi:hypothetical protein